MSRLAMSRLAAHRITTAIPALGSIAMVVLFLATHPADAGWNNGHGGGWGGGWGGYGHGYGYGGWSHSGWGHGHGGNAFGFSLGLNLTPGYWGPPPVIHAPPPVVYAPAPVVVEPLSPTYLAPSGVAPSGRYCREFQGSGVIGGRRVPIYGTACQQPDGAWRVVR